MKMKLRIFLTALVAVVFILMVGLSWFFISEKRAVERVDSFETCVENGFPVMESLPRRCATPDGRTFTEEVVVENNNLTHDLISVFVPSAGNMVTSPLTTTGQARGYWFFEASFPVDLLDSDGQILATGIAQAQGEWMTEEFVPFSATLTFTNSKIQEGSLVFHRDNPSGLPQNDDQFVIPVKIGVTD